VTCTTHSRSCEDDPRRDSAADDSAATRAVLTVSRHGGLPRAPPAGYESRPRSCASVRRWPAESGEKTSSWTSSTTRSRCLSRPLPGAVSSANIWRPSLRVGSARDQITLFEVAHSHLGQLLVQHSVRAGRGLRTLPRGQTGQPGGGIRGLPQRPSRSRQPDAGRINSWPRRARSPTQALGHVRRVADRRFSTITIGA
jgi:hypothetical protein